MLSILGAGFAYPEGEISNEILRAMSQEDQPYALTSRRTGLKLDYLLSTKNADPRMGSTEFVQSPTDLAFRAARMAMEQAGIAAAQIGLIIGATDTPLQVTPGESQRVGERLGEKIEAFDLSAGLVTLGSQLHACANWKAERMPEYVLCLASSAPTQRTNYQQGVARSYMGDGAYAFILSKKHGGFMSLEAAELKQLPARKGAFRSALYGHIEMQDDAPEQLDELTSNLLNSQTSSPGSLLICNSFSPASAPALALRHQQTDFGVSSDLANFGNALCAFAGAILARGAHRVSTGAMVTVALAGFDGLGAILSLRRN